MKKSVPEFGFLSFSSYVCKVMREILLTPKDMKTIFLVLPYTNGYTAPLTSKIMTFMVQEEAYDYAHQFKWVEIITTKLKG